MEAQSKAVSDLRTLRLCMLVAVALYFILSMRLPVSSRATNLGRLEIIIALIALWCVYSAFYVNRRIVRKAEALVKEQPDNLQAVRRFRAGYILIYIASFAVGLYGLVLHFFGSPVTHVVPFFAVSVMMISWFRPSRDRDGLVKH